MARNKKNLSKAMFDTIKTLRTAGLKIKKISDVTEYGQAVIGRVLKAGNWELYSQMKAETARINRENRLAKKQEKLAEKLPDVTTTNLPEGTEPVYRFTNDEHYRESLEEKNNDALLLKLLVTLERLTDNVGRLVEIEERRDVETKAYRERKRYFWEKENQKNGTTGDVWK